MLRYVVLEDLLAEREGVDEQAMRVATAIVDGVRTGGAAVLRRYAEEFGDLPSGGDESPLWLGREALEAAWSRLTEEQRGVLRRTARRIEAFARGQRRALVDYSAEVQGFAVGHRCDAVASAGCYAPGGRYPLPSSVLMTAVTARVAGVERVAVASPGPGDLILGAAFVAGADGVLPVGGAQGIAALAYGIGGAPRCDVVVGPGNRFVTAAKYLVSRHVGIDMLAGPSELVVVADAAADPRWIAADLLAQAEHDPDARPILVALDRRIAERVEEELARQLSALPTREVALAALRNGGALCGDVEAAVAACDAIAPEHLALHLQDAEGFMQRVRHYGAVFVGGKAAEVFGDYGVGPNHVLPTGGAARYCGGLSVFDFLRVRTYVRGGEAVIDGELAEDVRALAEIEGLVGHARSAVARVE